MFFNETRKAVLAHLISAALGIFLLVNASNVTAGPFPATNRTQSQSAPAPAPDSSCRVLNDANDKLSATPFHMYIAVTRYGTPVPKGEIIFTVDNAYLLNAGTWSPDPQEAKELREEHPDSGGPCRYVRDEAVNGEAAAIYSRHTEWTALAVKKDSQFWVSKSRGLILREETDTIETYKATSASGGTTHLSLRYDYANVQAPPPDSPCQDIDDANYKTDASPFHLYQTFTGSATPNETPVSSEVISLSQSYYGLNGGKWVLIPLQAFDSPADYLKQVYQLTLRNVENRSCQYVRDESVNGESASVYSQHSEYQQGAEKVDAQIWVLKSKGLIVRSEADVDKGGANGKGHVSNHYEYDNIKAPPL